MTELLAAFGERLQENVTMDDFTTARVGGRIEGLLVVNSAEELEEVVNKLWKLNAPFRVIGSGSNILVSDSGLREIIVVNHAHNIKIDAHHIQPTVWAESGANLSRISRQVALRGLGGLEWACGIPGTLGGAVYGNAGANDGDTKNSLVMADILHPDKGRLQLTSEDLEYQYRSSNIKRRGSKEVILAARLQLVQSTEEEVRAKMEGFTARRRKSQPGGASMGSMFKNPPGDYAGRLIEAAGLKGHQIGGAEISSVHANFFINHGNASAADIYRLVDLARKTVEEKFGIQLELEIEIIGDWKRVK
jgi:UDP-N-acetylmuramate dehydrogenase